MPTTAPHLRARAGFALLAMLASGIILALACHEPTAPRSRLAPGDDPMRRSVVLLGSSAIRVPTTNAEAEGVGPSGSGLVAKTFTGIHIPAWTNFVVKVRGRLTVARNPRFETCYATSSTNWSAAGSYGPLGTGSALRVNVSMKYPNNTEGGVTFAGTAGASGPDSVTSDTIFTWTDADIWAGRDGIWTHTSGSTCNYEDVGQWVLSGAQTVSVEEITGDVLVLTASPSYAHPRTQVTFTPSLASGQPLTSTINWRWTPDSAGTDSTAACGTNAKPCVTRVYRSGTMRVAGNINGAMKQAKAHVTIYSTFTVEASKALATVGDTVVFVAKLDGTPTTAARWKWIPDDSGVRDSTRCANTEICRKTMASSGTMWAYLASSDPSPSDGKRVAVTIAVTCAMGDSLWDSPNLRQKAVELFQLSNPDSTPGAGRSATDTTAGFKRERAAWILRDSNGRFFTQDVDSTTYYSDECHIEFPSAIPTPPLGMRYVAIIHSHPASARNNEAVYGSCHDQHGRAIRTYPDQPGRLLGHVGSDSLRGGGSDADWSMALKTGMDMFIINKDDEVWKLPAYTTRSDSLNDISNPAALARRLNHWRHNANSACDWTIR